MAQETKQVTVHFCTFKNKTTDNTWVKSKYEYNTVEEMLKNMQQYLTDHPETTVCFQTRTAYVSSTTEQP